MSDTRTVEIESTPAFSGALLGAIAPLWTDQMRAAGGSYALPISVYAALALAAAPLVASVRPSKADAG